jgi:integrase/recombinase XerD
MVPLTITQAVDGFTLAKRAQGLSPHTLEQYAYAYRKLSAFLSPDTPLPAISTDDLRRFLTTLDHLAPKTRHSIQVALSSLWTWAVAEGHAPTHPLRAIPLPRIHRPDVEPFSRADLRRLLAACDRAAEYTSPHHPTGTANRRPTALRDRALILFLVDTGLRASELCALTIANVNLEAQSALVRAGKGQKPRLVYFAKRAHAALWRYHVTRQPHLAPGQPLFHVGPADLPGPFDRHTLRRLLQRIGKRCGVECTPHRFRHTFAIEFLRNGGNLFALQDLLGHSNLEMVRRYARIVDADRARAHRVASPADNWRL